MGGSLCTEAREKMGVFLVDIYWERWVYTIDVWMLGVFSWEGWEQCLGYLDFYLELYYFFAFFWGGEGRGEGRWVGEGGRWQYFKISPKT